MARPYPKDAAVSIVNARFQSCYMALVAGSLIRGEGTATSDLDLVIVTDDLQAPYRESFTAQGYPVEAFVHTRASLSQYFADDAARRRPSLPKMCQEGSILRDTRNLAAGIKDEAIRILDAGPKPMTEDERRWQRYVITDLLDDFTGSQNPDEDFLIAPALVEQLSVALLDKAGVWQGQGKWLVRALKNHDRSLADDIVSALRQFYEQRDKTALIALCEEKLETLGGRLFNGYKMGGAQSEQMST